MSATASHKVGQRSGLLERNLLWATAVHSTLCSCVSAAVSALLLK
jgi:hypothetical protein